MEKHSYVPGARRESPPDVHRPQLSPGVTNDGEFEDEAPPVYELNLGSEDRNVAAAVLSEANSSLKTSQANMKEQIMAASLCNSMEEATRQRQSYLLFQKLSLN